MDTSKIGKQISTLRKERGLTQESLAEFLSISPQAVSKWENGHSLPETAVLPLLARSLDTSIDSILTDNKIQVLSAFYGDGIENRNVTARLNKLIQNDTLEINVNGAILACLIDNNRPKFITVKYQTESGIYYIFASENNNLLINLDSKGHLLSENAVIIDAVYGTNKMNYNVMHKIQHYKVFNWNEYHANHETFPSDPSGDGRDYLTFVYLNADGIHLVTCEEGESIAYNADKTELFRKQISGEHFIPNVPMLPPFGEGWECSWGAALTAALQAMDYKTDYEQVMGVSGACYRLAFSSPVWDYSSVDGLVAYDYASAGYKAFGFSAKFENRVDKEQRSEVRKTIMEQIRCNMPVLGINLRVAAEWGVICGYGGNGADLFCRTKYDAEILSNAEYEQVNPYNYLYVDNWPFIITFFDGDKTVLSDKENLINSIKILIDCNKKENNRGYRMGFNAYETWCNDLLDTEWYKNNDDEQLARRFSVNQFLTLALYDARKCAYKYLSDSLSLLPEISQLAKLFGIVAKKAGEIHNMLDSGEYLEGERARKFWTAEMRKKQASILSEMLVLEKEAVMLAERIV